MSAWQLDHTDVEYDASAHKPNMKENLSTNKS